MTYAGRTSGRVDGHPSGAGRGALGTDFLTYDDVEQALVEAMLLWRRAPDRERGWLHVRSYWPEIRRAEFIRVVGGELDWPEQKPDMRPLPLTRAEVATMTETSDWLGYVPERDRKLVAAAIAALASGKKRVPWMQLKRLMGVKFGADGLRMRYGRAIATICNALNAAENRKGGLSR